MATASAPASWLAHPRAEALLRFDMLPSTWLHPSRAGGLVPAALEGLAALHRHLSAALRREFSLQAVTGFDDPTLPIALLPDDRLARLAFFAGIALLRTQVRQAIAREPVAHLREQLGAEALDFAHPSHDGFELTFMEEVLQPEAARTQCERWGYAWLAQVFEAAESGVGRRALLRLPADTEAGRERLAEAGLAPAQALAMARGLMQQLEPTWLSSFPAAR